jgi:uncharacterized protein YndB with AHSA1/START domain
MPNIHQAVLIGAPVEKVYNAITSAEGLSAWWTPNTKATAKVNSVASFPFGDGYVKEMQITELKPSQLVKWKCIKGADEWVGTNLTYRLIPGDKESISKSHPEVSDQIEQQEQANTTLLIFHHDDWKGDTLMFAECSYTWGQFLKSLKLYCETGKGTPWPHQH